MNLLQKDIPIFLATIENARAQIAAAENLLKKINQSELCGTSRLLNDAAVELQKAWQGLRRVHAQAWSDHEFTLAYERSNAPARVA
jgi:hypothetical protein